MKWQTVSRGFFYYFVMDTGEFQKVTYPHYLALNDVLSGEIPEADCLQRKAIYEEVELKKQDTAQGIALYNDSPHGARWLG